MKQQSAKQGALFAQEQQQQDMPMGSMDKEAEKWLKTNTTLIEVEGKKVYATDSRALWELLGKPKGRHSNWWNWVIKSRNLEAEKDFFELVTKNVTNPKGGRPLTIKYLPKTTALKVGAITETELGRAILDRLVEIAERVENNDLTLVEEMLARCDEPEKIERVVISAQQRMKTYWRNKLSKEGRSEAYIQQFIEARVAGMGTRTQFTDCLAAHEVKAYASITDGMNMELFGLTAAQIKAARGLTKSRPARDAMDIVELAAVQLAEAMSLTTIEGQDARGDWLCHQICTKKARQVATITRPN